MLSFDSDNSRAIVKWVILSSRQSAFGMVPQLAQTNQVPEAHKVLTPFPVPLQEVGFRTLALLDFGVGRNGPLDSASEKWSWRTLSRFLDFWPPQFDLYKVLQVNL